MIFKESDEGGFEPPIPSQVCRFSRPGPSTTQTFILKYIYRLYNQKSLMTLTTSPTSSSTYGTKEFHISSSGWVRVVPL